MRFRMISRLPPNLRCHRSWLISATFGPPWRHGFLSIIERYDSYLSTVKRWASVGFADSGFGSDNWLDGTAPRRVAICLGRRTEALRPSISAGCLTDRA